jgi:hypothetical protein
MGVGYRQAYIGCENVSGSGSCPVEDFGVSGVEPSCSPREAINLYSLCVFFLLSLS